MRITDKEFADMEQEMTKLREQLAAEREKHKSVTGGSNPYYEAHFDQSERDWSEHLRIQLAAEVEKVNKLREQLAAKQESAKPERLSAESSRKLLGQPKPATGEWAYNYEEGYWSVTNGTETINGKTFGGPLIGIAMTEKSAKYLCDAHNAALAAERETYSRDMEESHCVISGKNEEIEHMAKQLAADQEAYKVAIADLRELLAAERERAEASEYNFGVQVDETKRLTAELERERMCHAACGVIAMSNTRESLETNKAMKPEYLSASVQDCIRAREREIALREQLSAEREKVHRCEVTHRHVETIELLKQQLAAERKEMAKVSR